MTVMSITPVDEQGSAGSPVILAYLSCIHDNCSTLLDIVETVAAAVSSNSSFEFGGGQRTPPCRRDAFL
jgi:hypothetical protein